MKRMNNQYFDQDAWERDMALHNAKKRKEAEEGIAPKPLSKKEMVSPVVPLFKAKVYVTDMVGSIQEDEAGKEETESSMVERLDRPYPFDIWARTCERESRSGTLLYSSRVDCMLDQRTIEKYWYHLIEMHCQSRRYNYLRSRCLPRRPVPVLGKLKACDVDIGEMQTKVTSSDSEGETNPPRVYK